MPDIMIIDDDIHINKMLCEVLQNEGYNASKAYSGTEAMLLLSQIKPDLILLDLMLPGLTGEKLLPNMYRPMIRIYVLLPVWRNDFFKYCKKSFSCTGGTAF